MNKITKIFREFAPEYLNRFGDRMPHEHRKALEAILSCRTEKHGLLYYECNSCGRNHIMYRSCGNRHCPACQNHKTREWLARQCERQLPGHHFMVTFTVPGELRDVIRKNQRTCYGAMFKASSKAMGEFAAKSRHVKGDSTGFFGVLHTWGRQLQYHPHIHYLVPGGAISKKDGSWIATSEGFFLPAKALAKIFRGKFRHEMEKAGLLHLICPSVWNDGFNVDIKPAGNGENCIKYLTPYIFKVAISEHRIVRVNDRSVTIKYRKKGCKRWRIRMFDAIEFMRRYLQHVLPTGFMKVRYYGFMSPASSLSTGDVRKKVIEALETVEEIMPPEVKIKPPLCKHCGSALTYLYSIPAYQLPPPDYG